MPVPEIKRDNVLVPITDIKWVAKNVFTVCVPLYKKVISCELAAVDVPRGTAPLLESTLMAVLERVRRAPHKYLRQDYYSSFPLQGYGDIVFALEVERVIGEVEAEEKVTQWDSLQESLLRHGAGRIVRPVNARLEYLIDAEIQGSSCPLAARDNGVEPCTWAKGLLTFESSSMFRKVLTGRVVDVLRGDVYVVHWDEGCRSNKTDNSDMSEEAWPPPLVVLDAVKCFSPRTDIGYRAKRWMQKNLIFSHVEVCVHCTSPSEKDVANNTQLYFHEQLRCVRASVRLLDVNAPAGGGSARSIGDVGCELISMGLGFVRQVLDAAMPRASGFHDLLRAASTRCCAAVTDPLDATVPAAENTSAFGEWVLEGPPIPSGAVQTLRSFFGDAWLGCPPLVALWQTTMWSGRIDRSAHDYPPCVHDDRPMRTLWSMETLLKENITFDGYVKSMSLLQESRVAHHNPHHRRGLQQDQDQENRESQPRLFLRMEINAVFTDATVCSIKAKMEANNLGSITLYPPEGTIFRSSANVSVVHERMLSATQPNDAVYLSASVTSYRPHMYDPKRHCPAFFDNTVRSEDGKQQTRNVIKLKIEDNAGEMFFVVDVEVQFGSRREVLRHRGIYHLITSSQLLDDGSESSLSEGSDGDGDRNDDIDKEKDSLPGDNSNGVEMDGQRHGRHSADLLESAAYGTETVESWNKETVTTTKYYHCIVDFYFEVDAVRAKEGNFPTQKMREWGERLMYRDVHCVPVGIGVVNGDRGYIGDIRQVAAAEQDGSTSPAGPVNGGTHSVLSQLMKEWWPAEYQSQEMCGRTWGSTPYLVKKWYLRMPLVMVRQESEIRERLNNEYYELLQPLCEKMHSAGLAVTNFASFLDDCRTLKKGEERVSSIQDLDGSKSDDDDDNDNDVFAVSAGKPTFWYHVEAEVPPVEGREAVSVCGAVQAHPKSSRCGPALWPVLSLSLLPPNLPLFVLSISPRQLFTSHHEHHRTVACGSASQDIRPNMSLHIDASFVRLPRRFLPFLFASNYERLPVAMRNVERAFCDSLQQDDTLRQADSPKTMLYAAEGPFVGILSALLLLQRKPHHECGTHSCPKHVYTDVHNLMESEQVASYEIQPSVCCRGVLYRVYPEVDGEKEEQQQQKQPVLFFGSRDTVLSDAFDTPQCVFARNGRIVKRAVSVLGLESLVAPRAGCIVKEESDETCVPLVETSGEECHPMVSRGMGQYPLTNATPRLYHRFSWLAVLGPPLFAHDEFDAETLGRRIELAEGGKLVRRHVAVMYMPLNTSKNPYVSSSYGQMSRRRVYRIHHKRVEKGGWLRDYLSLLLRCRSVHAADADDTVQIADGVLHVYGTANEPLYLFYQTRKQLRFHLGMMLPSILASPDSAEDAASAEAESEEQLIRQLSEAGKRIIELVAERTAQTSGSMKVNEEKEQPPSRVYLDIRADCQLLGDVSNVMRVSVYPVVGEAKERNTASESSTNPHQPFDMYENVYGVLAQDVLVVKYVESQGGYVFEWDQDYERTPDSPRGDSVGH
ncbi:hypothetical protein DQ04_00331090 [Trypanosoma grayi]|uniref:hypothetical protein n=1 Tax=Trypanosoma grayi TaxID=71804 RepID=UPI0004F4819A|nr:hypothetical protein DQ04_00331090 [Trypanosoma grayi]KEG14716.1 hypothetical protein DQ04_00331090 [Trypanosoma grayi]